jgi:murein DD-endopeptidase MepM/ murein hydrolase activator NlpD
MKEPVKNHRISSKYGKRILSGKEQFHDGIDFVSRDGNTDVFSVGPGVCTFDFDNYDDKKRWNDVKHSAGNYVIIKTTLGNKDYYVRYLHLRENSLSNGQKVEEGEKIGEYADVGYSFGAHLHFDMYTMAWEKIDPTPVIKSIL